MPIMLKNTFKMYRLLLILLLSGTIALAQEKPSSSYTEISIGLSPQLSSYQDLKFSNTILSGLSAGLDFDYTLYRAGIWTAKAQAFLGKMKATTHEQADYSIKGFDLSVSYLHPSRDWESASVYIGGEWSVLNYFNALEANLGNSAESCIAGSNFSIAAKHMYILKNERLLTSSLSFQLFSFMKEIPGFAAPYPQGQAENGEFDYQDDGAIIPFALETYYFNPFWKFIRVNIGFDYALSDNWSAKYNWELLQSYTIKKQALSIAQHSLGIRYTF